MTRGLPLRVRQLLRDISYQIIIRNHIFFVFGHFFCAIGKKNGGHRHEADARRRTNCAHPSAEQAT